MKKFKFRAWDIVNDQMVSHSELSTSEIGEVFGNEDLEIMQDTGMKDKNGVDIYEGDVVKYSNSIENGIGEVKSFFNKVNMHIEWIEQNTSKPSIYTSLDYLGCSAELEVIGNIYENPKLL